MGVARVAQYTENVSFLASPDMKAEIEAISDTYQVSAGAVWRRAVEIGLELTRQEYAAMRRGEAVSIGSTGTVDFGG